jgi:hypothetical protein
MGAVARVLGEPADRADRGPLVVGLVLTSAVLLGAMLFLDAANLDVWTGTITFLVLVAASVPLFRWIARKDGDPWMFRLYFGGLVLKLLFSLVRYFFIFVVYDSNGDAGVYHEAAAEFVRRFQAGIPIHPLPIISHFPVESQRIGDLTGVIYILTGTSAYAGFFVFSWLCFLGQVLFVRGLHAAVPEADQRRYAAILLFLPSLLFWPSSIGKEASMIFCLGILAYGGALLLAPKPRAAGALYFAIGLALVLLVRPHIAAMSLAALILAMGVGALSRSERLTAANRALRIVVLVGLLAAVGTVSTALSSSFEEGADTSSVALSQSANPQGTTESRLEKTLEQTSIGKSEYSAPAVSTPLDLPWAVVSVLFRPFPWEARNLNSLIAAAEGALLVALFVLAWKRLRGFPRLALRRPYLIFVSAYVLVFAIAFSYVGNFGILTRQRTQMLPAALAFLALPVVLRRGRDDQEEPSDLVVPEVYSSSATSIVHEGEIAPGGAPVGPRV